MMSSRFIHTMECVSTSFFSVIEEYSVVWIGHILFIHSSVHGHLGFSSLFGYSEEWCYEHSCTRFFLFEHLFSILLDIYVGMELLGHIIILCLTLWGTAKLVFRRGYAILCSYRQCMRFSIFPHPYNTGYFLLILFYFSHRCEVVSHCCF